MWTRFMDMHSGGGTKEGDYEYIYIEAPEDKAVTVFYNRFDHNPNRVTCTCCGPDYSIRECKTLEEATAYERNCAYDESGHGYVERVRESQYMTFELVSLEDYLKSDDVLVIYAADIKESERDGDVPEQGYVWKD